MGSAYGAARSAEPTDLRPARRAGDRFAMCLPARAEVLRPLRGQLTAFLTARGVTETDIYDIIVATSEAVANAIEHPVRRVDAVILVTAEIVDDQVMVSVRDSGHWRRPTESLARGRGLMLIGALAELDVRADAEGTTLTMRRQVAVTPGGWPGAWPGRSGMPSVGLLGRSGTGPAGR